MWKIFVRVVTVSAQVPSLLSLPSLLCNLTLAPTPLSQLLLLTEQTALLCQNFRNTSECYISGDIYLQCLQFGVLFL